MIYSAKSRRRVHTFLCALLVVAGILNSQAMAAEYETFQQRWAQAMYKADPKQREPLLSTLADEVRTAAANNNQAELLIWQGIILSTLAGERSGFGALGLAKEARTSFESAIKTDSDALAGSAFTSLGTLYHQVPGWPIGFGSDKKALKFLERGLAMNPNGIDANFFTAQYWLDNNQAERAHRHLLIAQQAPPRAGRELADQGRRQEVDTLLASMRQ